MNERHTFKEIVNSSLVKNTIKKLFKNNEIETTKRYGSFIIRLKNEPEDKIFRVIILPPHGFTANNNNETNPHPEVRKAKIEIKGAIKPNASGFNFVKNCIKYQFYTSRDIDIKDGLYPKIHGKNYREKIKSSREKFFVVKENGAGFYHSLINLTDYWILLVLEKELKLQKCAEIEDKLRLLDQDKKKFFQLFYEKVLLLGDRVFSEEKDMIEKMCSSEESVSIPFLVEMLNIAETGKHEPCTVYAVILKIGKKNAAIISYLKNALHDGSAPKYYLEELIEKLSKH